MLIIIILIQYNSYNAINTILNLPYHVAMDKWTQYFASLCKPELFRGYPLVSGNQSALGS